MYERFSMAKTHESWQLATEVGVALAKDRQESEKQAVHAPTYGKERLKPMEFAERWLQAGPELKMKMLKGMRQPRDGMQAVHRFIEAVNKVQGKATSKFRPPQIGAP